MREAGSCDPKKQLRRQPRASGSHCGQCHCEEQHQSSSPPSPPPIPNPRDGNVLSAKTYYHAPRDGTFWYYAGGGEKFRII